MKGRKGYGRKRWISGWLAVFMIFGLVFNQPISTWSYSVLPSSAASASDAVRDTKVTFTGQSSEDVEIAVLSDEAGYEAGDVICLDLYIKNNTSQTITEGLLKYRGSGILEDSAYFEDISDLYIEETGAFESENTPADQDKAEMAEADQMDGPEEELPETEPVQPAEELESQGDIETAEAGDGHEDQEEEDPKRLTDLVIYPGQSYFVNFYCTIDDTIQGIKGQNISFSFRGKAGNKTVRAEQAFRYVIGAMNLLPVELDRDGILAVGENGEMLLEFDLGELQDMIQEAEMKAEADLEEEASPSNGKKNHISGSAASPSQAAASGQISSNARKKTASPSQIGAGEEEDHIASSSNAWIRWDADPSQPAEKKEVRPLADHLKLQVETRGLKLKNVRLSHDAEEDGENGYGTSSVCTFQVDSDAEPGVYYGQVTASYQVGSKKLRSTQGFILTVTEMKDEQVAEVIAQIDMLPEMEEIRENFTAYEIAEDEDGYNDYFFELQQQVCQVYQAYRALTEEQQKKVSNADKLMKLEWLWSVMTLEGDFPVLEADNAYVKEIAVAKISDGVAPWDSNDDPGNDTGDQNGIVRTFDTVTYQFQVSMSSYDDSVSYSEARVKLEFVLPLTAEQAVFDQGAMAWMDQASGYAPKLTTETRSINGKATQCQVLTCYKRLLPSEGHQSVVPGTFGENVTVNVKSMKHGETFAPIFSAAMEHGAWEGDCPDHKQQERYTVEADEIKVTAAPKYNIRIGGSASYKSVFDFNSGNEIAKGYGDGYGKGQVTGRAIKYGVVIQLYNDNASKGLKGIELPNGDPITFDLEVSSQFTINMPNDGSEYTQGTKVDTTEDYTPLLWSCDGNMSTGPGQANSDGRVLYDSHGCAQNWAPYARGGGENACYDSGTWRATQSGDTIHVTVSGYQINVEKMPTTNGDTGTGNTGAYGVNLGIGCFSAGEIWLVQPYNRIGDTSSNPGPEFDIVTTYGQGKFDTSAHAVNMAAETVSGTQFRDSEGTSDAQTKTDDDWSWAGVELTLPGSIQNRVSYANPQNYNHGVGTDSYRDGLDFATVGTEIRLLGGFSYNHRNEEENTLYWGTNLTKFYGSAIELTDTPPNMILTGGAQAKEFTVLYATKKDGTDWASDYELQHTYEDDMIFYKELSEIPAGSLCTGLLFCFKEDTYGTVSEPYFFGQQPAKVRDNMDLAGESYMIASTSRVWTKSMLEQAGISLDEIPDWTEPDTKLSDFPSGYLKSGNIQGSVWYVKTDYSQSADGIVKDHNSDWRHWGDTLLVIGYKTGITKTLCQTSDNTAKNTYNLDAEQRVADFKLEPRTYYDQGGGNHALTTTVTIVDTLPKHLAYRPGSCYFGGTYSQTSINGGTQGSIAGGMRREPDSVVSNGDGTQTLTWRIPNLTVGETMPAIYYSADIGSRNDPNADVPTGTTNLLNTVRIAATHDMRQPSIANGNYAEEGIAVTRGAASSFGKYSKQHVVEDDGQIDYVIYYDNNGVSEDTQPVLVDAMPYNDIRGSSFTGSFAISDFTITLVSSKADSPDTLADLDAELHYTTDPEYAGKDLAYLQEHNGTLAGWEEATINPDGTVPGLKGKMPVMWVLNCIKLPGNSELKVEYSIKLTPENGYSLDSIQFVNAFSTKTTTITTETPAVKRTLEGLAWLDENANGIQDEDEEQRMSGVKVTLMKLIEGGDPDRESDYREYHYQGDPARPVVQIETGKRISVRAESQTEAEDYGRGRYKFTDLPAGTFAVRFQDGETDEGRISHLLASPPKQGSNPTMDSDGAAVYASKHASLERTVILNIDMPAAEEMSVVLYESKYHDSGFYGKGPELPETGGRGPLPYTAGGMALMAFAALCEFVWRKKRVL